MMAVLALVQPILAGGKKDDKLSISLHMETESTDDPKMMFRQEINGQTRYFKRTPEISHKDIVAFSPFPSDVTEEYGVVFKLKGSATNRLAVFTNLNQGRWMVIQVNGRMVDSLIIDRPVNDGLVVVWKGIKLSDMEIFDKSMPRIGEKKGDKKKTEKKK